MYNYKWGHPQMLLCRRAGWERGGGGCMSNNNEGSIKNHDNVAGRGVKMCQK